MANSGPGNKFMPVNLNRSYGHNSGNGNNSQHSGSQYGAARSRNGGGGSMVVLSRPRSSQKSSMPKLSVPPPLNLPSLRKEHQRFDSSGSLGAAAGGGGAGIGSRPGSSGVGWSKSAVVMTPASNEGETSRDDSYADLSVGKVGSHGGSAYVPPSARMMVSATAGSLQGYSSSVSGKVSVLKGEDFPSLKATLPYANSSVDKKKDTSEQKPKRDEIGVGSMNLGLKNYTAHSSQVVNQSKSSDCVNEISSGGKPKISSGGEMDSSDRDRKRDYHLPGFPSVRMNPRADWDDDERDTGHALMNKGRDHGFTKTETYWDRDYDFPRPGIFPHKPLHHPSGEFGRAGNGGKDLRTFRDGMTRSQPALSKGTGFLDRDLENLRASNNSRFDRDDNGRRDSPYNHGGKQGWNDHSGRHRGDSYQNSSASKSGFISNPILNVGREKHVSSKNGNSYLDDPMKDAWMADSSGKDIFPVVLHGLAKKKKDALKEMEYYDPIRESFEAELERVQKMQEMERQRTIEEQERAMEIATREEEERRRIAREQKEYQTRMEEEAREANWRAEQERMEALQRAEEQRVAREEEKRRIHLEEERRKQAARQMLIELEEKIARRKAEAANVASSASDSNDGKSTAMFPKDQFNAGEWENSGKVTPSSSDFSVTNRKLEPDHNQESFQQYQGKDHHSTRWDEHSGGRFFSGREFQGGSGNESSRGYGIGASSDIHMDGLEHAGEKRWNSLRDGNQRSEMKSNGVPSERAYHDTEMEGVYSMGRSRYSSRQPRVLPPPSFNSIRRVPLKEPGSSTNPSNGILEDEILSAQMQENNSEGHKMDSGSTPCDSQSSFSVSSPPDTPAHQSHDDFDESNDFPLAVADKGTFNGEMNDVESSSGIEKFVGNVSTGEEEGWTSDRNEELQEQEEYDEDESYEEDEGHDGEDEHSKMAHEFEGMNIEDASSSHMDNLVLCFNEGVEVIMPNDDGDRSSMNENILREASLGNQKDHTPFDDALCSMRETLATEISDSSRMMIHVENPPPDADAPASFLAPNPEIEDPSHSRPEVPLNLQFGLFSSPPLIPSPVPAIQIGSIQMPLHMHPPIGPITSSSQPLFHFGELRYTSPITQGILPMAQSTARLSESATDFPSRNDPGDPGKDVKSANESKPPVIEERLQNVRSEQSSEVSKQRSSGFPKNHVSSSAGRGRRYEMATKSTSTRSLLPTPDASQLDPGSFQKRPRRQRSEFRIRGSSGYSYDASNDRLNMGRNGGRHAASRHFKRNWKPHSVDADRQEEDAGNSKKMNERVDASLQDRAVRVFEQPGIEPPSDDDDFIKVRSKRQLLNERRAQRVKESKAKSRLSKVPRKLNSVPRAAIPSSTSGTVEESTSVGTPAVSSLSTRSSVSVTTPIVSQPLPPIGTTASKTDKNAPLIRPTPKRTLTDSVYDGGDDADASWDTPNMRHEVMSLTQTQLDEAMQPRVSSTPPLMKEKTIPSASPVSSLLAGERIQFGAVTSPTILPASSTSHNVGLRRSVSDDICSLFFDKEKKANLQESEAVAEAAASAVAVAAIGNDENGGQIDGIAAEVAQQNLMGAEGPLNVALPADLSVETPPFPMWPQLSSPQNCVPAHFPFYEINPLIGGRIFAFEQPDDSKQAPPLKANASSSSAPLASWHHHPNIDSIYGPPASFAAPFPSNVPAPPHMVVYNHFAPVGLSFMGAAAYVPSGKQPDWKHIPSSSSSSLIGEGDIPSQHNPSNMHAAMQHSVLHPIASPLTMFDSSSLQGPPDRWSLVPASHLQPVQTPENSLPLNHRTSIGHQLPDELGIQSTNPINGGVPSNSDGSKEVINVQMQGNSMKMQGAMKAPAAQQQYGGNHPKYGFSPRGEWGQRRSGRGHHHHHPSGGEGGFSQFKTKQIYVAKQSVGGSGASTAS